jgi:hypothetical protein
VEFAQFAVEGCGFNVGVAGDEQEADEGFEEFGAGGGGCGAFDEAEEGVLFDLVGAGSNKLIAVFPPSIAALTENCLCGLQPFRSQLHEGVSPSPHAPANIGPVTLPGVELKLLRQP